MTCGLDFAEDTRYVLICHAAHSRFVSHVSRSASWLRFLSRTAKRVEITALVLDVRTGITKRKIRFILVEREAHETLRLYEPYRLDDETRGRFVLADFLAPVDASLELGTWIIGGMHSASWSLGQLTPLFSRS